MTARGEGPPCEMPSPCGTSPWERGDAGPAKGLRAETIEDRKPEMSAAVAHQDELARLQHTDKALRAWLRDAVRAPIPDPCEIESLRKALIDTQWRVWRLAGSVPRGEFRAPPRRDAWAAARAA
jgi:hypothetical protein